MTQRESATPVPGPLEAYTRACDLLFGKLNQRDTFRRYLEGLLLPAERNKILRRWPTRQRLDVGTLRAQALPWFLSESD